MWLSSGFQLIIVVAFISAEDNPTDKDVVVLKKENFSKFVEENSNVLVEFYAPWCGHCKALAPEYSKAAKELKEQGSMIILAKVDATEETQLAEEYQIRGYPTLKFFRNAIPTEYSGGRDANSIVAWLLRKTGPPAQDLTTIDEAEKFIDSNNVVVVGFFKDVTNNNKLAEAFTKAASDVDDYTFGICTDQTIMDHYDVIENTISVFKKFDEKHVKYDGDSTPNSIISFIRAHGMPLVVEFNHDTAQKIFGGDIKVHLLLFVNKNEDHFNDVIKAALSVAPQYRGRVIFVHIDCGNDENQRILEFFGIKNEQVPTMRIIKLEEDMAKYKPDDGDELAISNIESFVQSVLDGTLKQHFLSQIKPEDWDSKPVKVLVATNFDDIVLDPSKNVLVEFYAPWCAHCNQLSPIYDELGQMYKDDPTIVIAKIDATANELEHTKINSFPTIKLYKQDDNTVVDYTGPRTLEGLAAFVQSGGVDVPVPSDVNAEDTQEDDAHPKDEL